MSNDLKTHNEGYSCRLNSIATIEPSRPTLKSIIVTPMKLRDIVNAMERIAPTRNAESWDNVGLLVGDPEQSATKALLCIDYTAEVAAEGKRNNCDVVIAYHPPIFEALKKIPSTGLIHQAIRNGIAIYSPHTALDVAEGGTNDMLADAAGLTDRTPLRVAQAKPSHYKLIVFVPEKNLEAVSQALFNAGAGRIGQYSSCSFRSPGTGTFFGEPNSNPTVGQSGKLEEVAELRLETVLPIHQVEQVLQALRQSHPYEEPAFDLVQLAAPPESRGMGKIGTLPTPTPFNQLLSNIKRELSLEHLLVAGPTDRNVERIAVCAGACGDHLNDAITKKADVYITGEMRHHDAIKATQAGLTVICTLHSNSERKILKRLARQLEALVPGLASHLSEADRDPFAVQ